MPVDAAGLGPRGAAAAGRDRRGLAAQRHDDARGAVRAALRTARARRRGGAGRDDPLRARAGRAAPRPLEPRRDRVAGRRAGGRASTAACCRPRARRTCGCRCRSRCLERRGVLRGRRPARPPLDARRRSRTASRTAGSTASPAAYPSRPGKGIRPALCVATSRAFGGDDGDVLPVAVAIELLHNAFLDPRRHRRRLRAPPRAPDAGRRVRARARAERGRRAGRARQPVLRAPRAGMLGEDLGDRVLAEFDAMALRTLEGQATELGWRHDRVDRARARGLPRPDHAQDVLVHDRAPAARRGADRLGGEPTCGRWCASASTSARRSRSRTTC